LKKSRATVGANLCVRPVISGRHAGLPLQSCTEKEVLFFLLSLLGAGDFFYNNFEKNFGIPAGKEHLTEK